MSKDRFGDGTWGKAMILLWSVSSKHEQHESDCLRMNQMGDEGYYQ